MKIINIILPTNFLFTVKNYSEYVKKSTFAKPKKQIYYNETTIYTINAEYVIY